jgi:hypothetical protein
LVKEFLYLTPCVPLSNQLYQMIMCHIFIGEGERI